MIEIEDIRRLNVRSGDKIVMKVGVFLTAEQMGRIQHFWNEFAPETKLLILQQGMSLDILSEATDEG